MQTAFMFSDFGGVLAEEGQFPVRGVATRPVARVKPVPRLQLSERDHEIFRFLLEMKFASLDELYFRFFRVNRDGSDSKSAWWARERLAVLRKHRFLTPVRLYSEPKIYFLPTAAAYRAVRMKCAGETVCKPAGQIDFNQFEHDSNLLWLRLDLEDRAKVTEWQSDRFLAECGEDRMVVGGEYRPDAIFNEEGGRKVAFELEIALKAKDRYLRKVVRYVELMKRLDETRRPFAKVLYVAKYEPAFERLSSMTRMYGPLFEVRRLSDFSLERVRTAAASKPKIEEKEIL